MLKFIRFYFKNFLTEVLLMGFGVFMLLIFVLMILSADNTLFIGEPCNPILYGETCYCAFVIYWASRGIARKIKKRRKP